MAIEVSRRGLLGIFAAGVSAAIVRPGLLMPIKPPLVPITQLIYDNRTIRHWMDIQQIRDRNVLMAATDYAGSPVFEIRGLPIRIVDQPSSVETA